MPAERGPEKRCCLYGKDDSALLGTLRTDVLQMAASPLHQLLLARPVQVNRGGGRSFQALPEPNFRRADFDEMRPGRERKGRREMECRALVLAGRGVVRFFVAAYRGACPERSVVSGHRCEVMVPGSTIAVSCRWASD